MSLSARARRQVEAFDRPYAALENSLETKCYLLVGEAEVKALAEGTVPEAVKEQARAARDWQFQGSKRIV